MASKIVLPAVALLVAIAIGSGDATECYECISQGQDGNCDLEKITKDMNNKKECSDASMSHYYTLIGDSSTARAVSRAFQTEKPYDNSRHTPPMSCIKMDLRINNIPHTLRTCYDTNTSGQNPCQVIENRLKDTRNAEPTVIKYCGWCENNLCNGSYVLSPTMIISMIPMIGSILMSLMHSSA